MKKRNLKSLELNKQLIYNLESEKSNEEFTVLVCVLTSFIEGFGIGCNSANGCSNSPYETLTCPHWSCACDGNPGVIDE
jgi:hypothetical protein